MVSIAEFPKEPKYTIKVLSERTGVLPVTLRAWERRYDLLDPERLDNNYRLYSERDIQVIRWINDRMEDGLSISNAVREYKKLRRKDVWPEALPTIQAPQPTRTPQHPPKYYAEKLYTALVDHREAQAKEILDDVQKMFDLRTVFLEILTPCLYQIGDAWYRGEIRIATEHYASNIIRGVLLNLLSAFPVYSNAPRILIGCAPEEFHELASLMLSVLLRREGYQVEFLGSDLPVEDLVAYAEDASSDMVIISAGFERTARPLFKVQAMLNNLPTQPIFGYGGRYFNENPAVKNEIQGVFLGSNINDAIQIVHNLLD